MIVFVHGVLETGAIWDQVRSHLDAESIALSLHGFASARPAGFGATKDDYAAWLLPELDSIDGPIDLVGHD
jgi:pimeloyl-ACP methyl ester carboxylesterase